MLLDFTEQHRAALAPSLSLPSPPLYLPSPLLSLPLGPLSPPSLALPLSPLSLSLAHKSYSNNVKLTISPESCSQKEDDKLQDEILQYSH